MMPPTRKGSSLLKMKQARPKRAGSFRLKQEKLIALSISKAENGPLPALQTAYENLRRAEVALQDLEEQEGVADEAGPVNVNLLFSK